MRRIFELLGLTLILVCGCLSSTMYASGTVIDTWREIKTQQYHDYRARIGVTDGKEVAGTITASRTGGPAPVIADTALTLSEWAQFYNDTGGGFYMNKFNMRLYDIIKIGGAGKILYFILYMGALFQSFGGMGVFSGKAKHATELPQVITMSFGVLISYLGAPYIFGCTQVLKDAIPTLVAAGIDQARKNNSNLAYLLEEARLGSPMSQVPGQAIIDGVVSAVDNRAMVLNDGAIVATMQLYNDYSAYLNKQLPDLNSKGGTGIKSFDPAPMMQHKEGFDGTYIDVSGADADKSLQQFEKDHNIVPAPL